jgi:hypothetical protein
MTQVLGEVCVPPPEVAALMQEHGVVPPLAIYVEA